MKKYLLTVVFIVITILWFTACFGENTSGKNNLKTLKAITTKDLKDKINRSDWVIVDTRSNDAFNGWKLDGVKKGGHITGAVDFSANWLKVDVKDKDQTLSKVLKTKGITSEKNIVLYDANGKDADKVAKYLNKNDIKNIYKYDMKQWVLEDNLPTERYENYQVLVPTSWINDLMNGKKPETYNGTPYKVFEVSSGDESKSSGYLKVGHIKGAVHISTNEVEEGPFKKRISDDRLKKFAESNGITIDTTVILYGTDPMPSFRIAAILKYMGVKDVRILNGGISSWKNSKYELEKTPNKKIPIESFGAVVPVNKGYIMDLPEVKEILKDGKKSKLVDIRSLDEYIGKTSEDDYIKVKGHIAGAVWGHAGTNSIVMEDFRNIDNTIRNKDEILSMWKKSGIKSEKKICFYSQTAWRASEALIYADIIGLKNISLYDGGLNEWSGSSADSIETGETKK
ncbi:rhodanese-like domain-containing protein [Clostridium muellerianum]|uniref:rhodanese-like domain-containing protein n=1 Tax=Clostridium muellerianum TaxID=2716538 RepID=UPI003CC97C37